MAPSNRTRLAGFEIGSTKLAALAMKAQILDKRQRFELGRPRRREYGRRQHDGRRRLAGNDLGDARGRGGRAARTVARECRALRQPRAGSTSISSCSA